MLWNSRLTLFQPNWAICPCLCLSNHRKNKPLSNKTYDFREVTPVNQCRRMESTTWAWGMYPWVKLLSSPTKVKHFFSGTEQQLLTPVSDLLILPDKFVSLNLPLPQIPAFIICKLDHVWGINFWLQSCNRCLKAASSEEHWLLTWV
jgi:hypothetical protein